MRIASCARPGRYPPNLGLAHRLRHEKAHPPILRRVRATRRRAGPPMAGPRRPGIGIWRLRRNPTAPASAGSAPGRLTVSNGLGCAPASGTLPAKTGDTPAPGPRSPCADIRRIRSRPATAHARRPAGRSTLPRVRAPRCVATHENSDSMTERTSRMTALAAMARQTGNAQPNAVRPEDPSSLANPPRAPRLGTNAKPFSA
jgi:hypothetical protein